MQDDIAGIDGNLSVATSTVYVNVTVTETIDDLDGLAELGFRGGNGASFNLVSCEPPGNAKGRPMPFDFKKEYRDLYQPKTVPSIVEVPAMRFLAVEGAGDPNEEGGEYKRAIELLYGVAYTLKMSYKGGRNIDGFYQYVVPPLEGFWWQNGIEGIDYSDKSSFSWISAIRVPEFVGDADFAWAVDEATRKKGLDFSPVHLVEVDEGLCVQCMHVGTYDSEPATVEAMHAFAEERGYAPDFSDARRHHEIYLSDPRKADPAKMKTVVRHPVRKA